MALDTWSLLCVGLLAFGGCSQPALRDKGGDAHVITRPDQLEAAVGQQVTLQGVVVNSRIATLVGVDVESESPDLRGKEATATGVLRRSTVTKEELDREIATRGQFANRGPGTFYSLHDDSGALTQVRPLRK